MTSFGDDMIASSELRDFTDGAQIQVDRMLRREQAGPRGRRASGKTQTEEVVAERSAEADTPATASLPEERDRKSRAPGFARMRLDWGSDERSVVAAARRAVAQRLLVDFADAYEIVHQVYDAVREPEVNPETGEVLLDRHGLTVWRKTPGGGYLEDFTKLTRKRREHLILQITTRIFEWRQRAGWSWQDAMFAKAVWEETYARAYEAPMAGTIQDRKAAGDRSAAEDRYFAIYLTSYSRQAEQLVDAMELLGQRLKDSMDF